MEEASVSSSLSHEEENDFTRKEEKVGADSHFTQQHVASTSYGPNVENVDEDRNEENANHSDSNRTPTPQESVAAKTDIEESSKQTQENPSYSQVISSEKNNGHEKVEEKFSPTKIESQNKTTAQNEAPKTDVATKKPLPRTTPATKPATPNKAPNMRASAAPPTPTNRAPHALRTSATRPSPAPRSPAQITAKTPTSRPPGERAVSASRTPRPSSVNGFQSKPAPPSARIRTTSAMRTTPTTNEIKPLPKFVNKKYQNVTSKVGSLDNATHKPGGGQIKIESRKFNFKETAAPKISAKIEVKPHVGEKKVMTQKLNWKAESKVGSLANANHQPKGGDVKILTQKIKLDGVQSKVGSLVNADHKAGGGNVDIKSYKVSESQNGSDGNSMDNSRRSSTNPSRMSESKDITA